MNDLYDTDTDRFMEIIGEVQDNPEYKKVEGEITTAREQFTQEKEKATIANKIVQAFKVSLFSATIEE